MPCGAEVMTYFHSYLCMNLPWASQTRCPERQQKHGNGLYAKVSSPIPSGAHFSGTAQNIRGLGQGAQGLGNIILMFQGNKVRGAGQHSSIVIKNVRLYLWLLLQYLG